MKKYFKKMMSAMMAIVVFLAIFIATPVPSAQAATAAELVAQINGVSGLMAAIDDTDPNVVNVTGSAISETATLTLDIDSGVTVKWGATLATTTNSNPLSLYGKGCFELVGGGYLYDSAASSYSPLTAYDNTTVIINGGSITCNSNNNAVYITPASGTSLFVMNGGTITSTSTNRDAVFIPVFDGATIVVLNGGTITPNGTMDACYIPYDADVYLTGTTLTTGGIRVFGDGALYYTGSNASKFTGDLSGFTLTALDVPVLSANNLTYTYSSTVPSTFPVLAQLPATALTYTSIAPSVGVGSANLTGGSYTFTNTLNNSAVTLSVSGTVPGTSIPVSYTTATFGVNVDGIVTPVALVSATPNGTGIGETTTEIVFEFNAPITGLTANDITFTPDALTKGALVSSNNNQTWTLAVSDVTPGNCSVAIANPAGYTISGTPISIMLNKTIVYNFTTLFPTVTNRSATNISGTIDADFLQFCNDTIVVGNVSVNNVTLAPDTHYTYKNGSTIITLTEAYLQTLANGQYSVVVTFADGGTATTTLTVNVTSATTNTGGGSASSPKTGDTSTQLLFALLGLVALGVGLWSFLQQQRKRTKR